MGLPPLGFEPWRDLEDTMEPERTWAGMLDILWRGVLLTGLALEGAWERNWLLLWLGENGS